MQQGIDITPRSISGRIVGELEILDLSANTMLCLAAIYYLPGWHQYLSCSAHSLAITIWKTSLVPYHIDNTKTTPLHSAAAGALLLPHYHYTRLESWSCLAQLLVRGHICDPFYPIIYHSLKLKIIKRSTGHGWADAEVLSLLMGFYKICDTNPWKIST